MSEEPGVESNELMEMYKAQMALNERVKAYWSAREQEGVSDYIFKGEGDREVSLSQLFGDHDKLMVIHNMGFSCPYCTLWADTISGTGYFYDKQGIALALSSPDTPEKQAAGKSERGWEFTMVSAAGNSFTADMGFEHEGDPMPGASTFVRSPDGSIKRYAKTGFGPGDTYCGAFHVLNLFPAANA